MEEDCFGLQETMVVACTHHLERNNLAGSICIAEKCYYPSSPSLSLVGFVGVFQILVALQRAHDGHTRLH